MEYDNGYAEIRMEEAYTLRMLADESRALTPSWNIYPRICYHRDVKGVVIYPTEPGRRRDDRGPEAKIGIRHAKINERKGRRPRYSCQLRVNRYVCDTKSPFSYLSCSLSLRGGFSAAVPAGS
jgi:hypothetical protein